MFRPHRYVAFRPFVALLAVLAGASACGPNPNSPSSISGTWVGTIMSSAVGNFSAQLTLSESGPSVAGTFAISAPAASTSATGPLTGTLNGSTLTVALNFGTCTRTWTGTWSGTALTGSYVASGACGTNLSGTFALTLE